MFSVFCKLCIFTGFIWALRRYLLLSEFKLRLFVMVSGICLKCFLLLCMYICWFLKIKLMLVFVKLLVELKKWNYRCLFLSWLIKLGKVYVVWLLYMSWILLFKCLLCMLIGKFGMMCLRMVVFVLLSCVRIFKFG